ncbi:MAG: hypothetical protein U0575_04485 [Phycisphaerales bacterium]
MAATRSGRRRSPRGGRPTADLYRRARLPRREHQPAHQRPREGDDGRGTARGGPRFIRRTARAARARGLGYKQLIDHLEGRISLEDAIEQVKIASRRFAKQQRTWLRRFRVLPNARFFAADGMDPDSLLDEVLGFVRGPVPRR